VPVKSALRTAENTSGGTAAKPVCAFTVATGDDGKFRPGPAWL
jgi:hypothetical protein